MGLKKALIVTVLIYYKAIRIKNQQRGRTQEMGSRRNQAEASGVPSRWKYTMCLTLPVLVSENTHKVLADRSQSASWEVVTGMQSP